LDFIVAYKTYSLFNNKLLCMFIAQLTHVWNNLQIIESYAFLPREAVTHFLMNCNECRSRMHLTPPSLETDVCWKTQSKHLPLSPLSGSLQSPSRCSSPTPSEVSIDVGCGSVSVLVLTIFYM